MKGLLLATMELQSLLVFYYVAYFAFCEGAESPKPIFAKWRLRR